MTLYRVYVPSMILSVLLSLAALVTLLPVFGLIKTPLYPPVSTLWLLGLAGINCMIRAEYKRKVLGA
jgi:hypothetical protein